LAEQLQAEKGMAAGVALALGGFALYSTHDVLIEFLGAIYSPVQIVFFGVMFGFPLVTLFMLRNPKTGSLWPRHPVKMTIRVVSTTLSGLGAFYSFTVLSLAEAYAMLFLTPVIVTLLAIPVLKESVGIHRGLAILFGFVGVLVILQPGVVSLDIGHLAALVSVVGAATNSVITRQIGQREKVAVMLLYPMIGNFLIMGAALPFVYKPMPLLHFQAMAVIALLGFLAMFCVVSAFRRCSASIVAPMQYSQIIWAGIYGLLFFDETIETSLILGAGMIILSGLYIVRRERQKAKSLQPVLGDITSRPETGLRPRSSLLSRFVK